MKHLRTFADLEGPNEVVALLQRALVLKRARRAQALAPTLQGRVIALWFERASTRTRISFEVGAALLGGSTVVLHARDTQAVRGEPVRDAARVLGHYVDVVIVRPNAHETVDEFARHAGIPVVNGLSNVDHPCQVLADLLTVFERREVPFSLRWTWLGDLSPVAWGYVEAARVLGFPLVLGVPMGAPIDGERLAEARRLGAKLTIMHDARAAVDGADVVVTGPWTEGADRGSLMPFRVDAALISRAADDAFVMHSLPADRACEISDDVLEGRHSLAFAAAGNRLPLQQAVLERLLGVEVDKRP